MDPYALTEQLHFLIKCLKTEMPEYAGYALPDGPQEAFDLYRALCNVRMPSGDTGHTLPDAFYTVQSEVLKSITEEKGITEAAEIAVRTDGHDLNPASKILPRPRGNEKGLSHETASCDSP